jgi:hypothetical protein
MYTFIILLVLCAAQAGLFYWKYSEIQEYADLGKGIAKITKADQTKQYGTFVKIASKLVSVGKIVLYVLIPVVFIINLIVASILGTILSFIF